MQKFLTTRMGALIILLILGASSISIVGTSQFVMGLDSNIVKNLVKSQETSVKDKISKIISSIKKSVGVRGEFTILVVFKIVRCQISSPRCANPSDFQISVTGNNPSRHSFLGSDGGTLVRIGPGDYRVTEQTEDLRFSITFEDDCVQDAENPLSATGAIKAGEVKFCTIVNTQNPT